MREPRPHLFTIVIVKSVLAVKLQKCSLTWLNVVNGRSWAWSRIRYGLAGQPDVQTGVHAHKPGLGHAGSMIEHGAHNVST